MGSITGSVAQDWANLKIFQLANKKIGLPIAGEDRVVFMGNSITIGWLTARPDFFKDKPFINRGIGGQTSPQMLLRFRQDVINLKPKIVVILAGTNDIAGNTGVITLEETLANIVSMAELAKANNISPIICSVLPAFDFPWRAGLKPNEKIPELNKMLKTYAKENNLSYVDYFSVLTDERNGLPKKYAEDGVHPTEEAYKIMEPLVLAAIANTLKNK